jgi:hypothetical protein
MPGLLQVGSCADFQCPLNRTFSSRDIRAGPEKAKPGSSLIEARRIECNPIVTGPHNMAEMPLVVGEATNQAGIAPYWRIKSCCFRPVDWFEGQCSATHDESVTDPGPAVNQERVNILSYQQVNPGN